MSTREDATRLLVAKVVRDRQIEAYRQFRSQVASFDTIGSRDIGVIDGQQIGSVRREQSEELYVVNRTAYVAWVQKHYPHVIVPTVPDAWTADREWDVRHNGVLPAGLEVRLSEPWLSVKPSEDAAEIIGQALTDGRLSWAEVATAAIEVAP